MKEYKYTIDGKEYKVEIGDIADNIANVTVNGEAFKVEMKPNQNPKRRRLLCSLRQHSLLLTTTRQAQPTSTQPMP